ncbi:MAG: hypothetical protein AAF531_10520 [Actinomycetota bacterium]
MARPTNEMPQAEVERLNRIRAEAAERFEAMMSGAPDVATDPLGYLAFVDASTVGRQFPFDPRLRDGINSARNQIVPTPWKFIAIAAGHGTTKADLRRLQDRQQWRNRTYDEITEDVG